MERKRYRITLACGHRLTVDSPEYVALSCAMCAEDSDPIMSALARNGYLSKEAVMLASGSRWPESVKEF